MQASSRQSPSHPPWPRPKKASPGTNINYIYIYAKADDHLESVQLLGLPDERAYHHSLFFFRWLLDNGLLSEAFMDDEAEAFAEFQQGDSTVAEW